MLIGNRNSKRITWRFAVSHPDFIAGFESVRRPSPLDWPVTDELRSKGEQELWERGRQFAIVEPTIKRLGKRPPNEIVELYRTARQRRDIL